MMASRSRPRPRRSGFGLIEMTVAVMLLAAGMVVTLQVIGWVAVDRRSVGRRERAYLEASNLLERAAARPWDDLTAERLAALRPGEVTARALPGLALAWDVADEAEPIPARRVTVEIRWRDRAGKAEATVRLVAWIYRREAAR